jgi:predicted transposase YdaD
MGEGLLTISRNEHERARLRSKMKYELDHITELAEAREEGWEQGIKQGIKQGIEQGIKRGIEQEIKRRIEQGIEQGSREKAEEIAVNLCRSGFPVEQIARLTGLAVDTVRFLCQYLEAGKAGEEAWRIN